MSKKSVPRFCFTDKPQTEGRETRAFAAQLLIGWRHDPEIVVRRVRAGTYRATLRHAGAPVAELKTR